VECFLNAGDRLVCKTCKQITKKAPEGQSAVPPGLFRHSKTPLELNHAADYISGFHEVECFLNAGVCLVCKTYIQTTKKANN
jgi:hypothetical protein